MKILFVIHSLEKAGGAEKVMTLLANSIVLEAQHEVSIVTMSQKEPFFHLNDSIKLIKLELYKLKSSPINTLKNTMHQINSLREVMVDNNSDVIISFISGMNIFSIIAAKLSGKPIIVAERSSFHHGLKNNFWKFLRRITYPYSNALIIQTDEDKPNYSFVKYIYKIYNPLVLKNEHEHVEKEKIILAVGRLHQIKGFDLLIAAFSKVSAKNWKLVIVGEGKEREKLENLIKKLDLSDRVFLHGITDDVEIFYKKSSIFVLSSRSEGFPNALCEAMAYGCACIAFDCPTGPKEIINDRVNGILVPCGNIDIMVKEIQYLINNPQARGKLEKSAKDILYRLNIGEIKKQWLEVASSIHKN